MTIITRAAISFLLGISSFGVYNHRDNKKHPVGVNRSLPYPLTALACSFYNDLIEPGAIISSVQDHFLVFNCNAISFLKRSRPDSRKEFLITAQHYDQIIYFYNLRCGFCFLITLCLLHPQSFKCAVIVLHRAFSMYHNDQPPEQTPQTFQTNNKR